MSTRKSNTAHLKSQPSTKLDPDEVQRIAQKLAVSLEHDHEDMSLLVLLISYLESVREDYTEFWSTVHTIKNNLFTGTIAFEDAQEQFQADAYKNKGKLLLWPFERKEGA